MEFWLLSITVEECQHDEDHLVLDLADGFWDDVLHSKLVDTPMWRHIEWCLDNNITFTIRAYTCYSEDYQNKEDFEEYVDFSFGIPCTPQDYIGWFINITDKDDALMYKITFGGDTVFD